MELHYESPAEFWDQAVPLGNGRLGAMVYGAVAREHIQLNEEGLWSGGPQDRVNPDCLDNLEKIRALFRSGQVEEAQRLAVSAMSGTPFTQRAYQTLGDLWIDFFDGAPEKPESYSRGLDLHRAVAWVRYGAGEREYERQYFISRPADCLGLRLTARGGGRLSFTCRLDRSHHIGFTGHAGGDTLVCSGDQNGIGWAMGLKVMASDGAVSAIGARLTVRDATNVTLIFTAKTGIGVNPGKSPSEGLAATVCESLSDVRARYADAGAMLAEHEADFGALFGRVDLRLSDPASRPDLDDLPTDARLRRFAAGEADPGLAALYFQYARYLMISGSRPGGLPLTLQGLWNEEFTPAWDSKYTININLEMNYWPVEVCALPECAEPYFDLLRRVAGSGRDTARRMYGCRGFVAHHNTDIHADTAPQDECLSATYWVMGGAWLSLHIWEHWLFTRDREFLRKNFDILEEAVLFFRDFLQENGKGELVTLPSISPENTFYLPGPGARVKANMCEMPTMDIEILNDLISAYLGAAEELGTGALVGDARKMLSKLPKLQIASDGRLMEWQEEYEEFDPGHRHISHLFGLYPSAQITPEDTPELAAAAKKSLEYRLARGGGYTGWSRAWIILFWARLREGDRAFRDLRALLTDSTFENLMDTHPRKGRPRGRVFQIDGNMGAAAGIAEMLVQSHNGRIRLLPALPTAWPEGEIRGLRVRGGGEVDVSWRDGRLISFRLLAHSPFQGQIVYGDTERRVGLDAGESIKWKAGN